MTEPKTELRVCRCGMEVVAEIKRGRPQTWCDPCRDGINASARQRMRVEEEESKPPDERRIGVVRS